MRGEWLYLFCRQRVGSSFLFYAIDCGKGPKWERKRGTRLCGGHAPARGDYHLDVRCSRIHYAVMLVSVLCPWCRKAVRSVFRNGAIRAYAMGVALCLLLSGCLFGSGNKQDTLQPMTDEAPNPAKKTIRYSVKLQSDPQNGDLVSELRENSQLVWLHGDLPDSRVGRRCGNGPQDFAFAGVL